MSTRKELIAEGKDITPLTREEYFLAGKDLAPLNVKEKVLKGVVGGGGSGDLSTATIEVTIDDKSVLNIAYAADFDGGSLSQIAIITSGTYNVILYKGMAFGELSPHATASATGDIVVDEGDIIVTGDGTLTISTT